MPDLQPIIDDIDAGLDEILKTCGSYAEDPQNYHRRHGAATRALADRLIARHGGTATTRYDGARVRFAGIASTSTSGLHGALHNWLTAARKRIGANA